jgi:cytochrome oxidase Cu insertion factor (SCO1/SenC/PrrC family)
MVNIETIQHNKKERRMKKIGLILVLFAFLVGCASTEPSPESSPESFPNVGDYAPDFSLVDVSGNEVRLGDFKGEKNVALIFYANHS